MNTEAPTGGKTRRFVAPAGSELAFDDVGEGIPVVALHGAYSTRHEILSVLEPVLAPLDTHRRLYPDLPGMGDTPSHHSVRTSNDIVDLLDQFVQAEIGDTPYLLVGHSYGGHLARGLATRHSARIAGLALICPLMPDAMNAEPHHVIAVGSDPGASLDPALIDEYTSYFVVHTRVTEQRFLEAVAPAIGRFDSEAVETTMSNSTLHPDPDSATLDVPTLILVGRHDSIVGYRDQLALLDAYPRATCVVVADAGHALAHEHPDLLARLVHDWVTRSRHPDEQPHDSLTG